MRIIYSNIAMDATITYTSEDVNYPASNLQDTRLSRYYRTAADTAQRITMAKANAAAQYFILWKHNLSAGATLKLQGNDTNVWTAPTFDQTIAITDDIILLSFASVDYNYWSVYIDDASNPDGYIQIGLITLGTYLQMPGMAPDQTLENASQTTQKISQTRQVYGADADTYRAFDVNFNHLTQSQRLLITTMYNAVKNITPVVLLIWSNDLTYETQIYAVITSKSLKWKRQDNHNFPWKLTLTFEEAG